MIDEHTLAPRFRVLAVNEAAAIGIEEARQAVARGYDYGWCLIERTPDGIDHFVASDDNEPEDQTFVRDWAWVPALLNRVHAEGDARTYQERKLIAAWLRERAEEHGAAARDTGNTYLKQEHELDLAHYCDQLADKISLEEYQHTGRKEVMTLDNIEVHRYAAGDVAGWAGYAQPKDGAWTLFIGRDGRVALFDAATDRVVVTTL